VPRLARSKAPITRPAAPVNAPRSCPNNELSTRPSGSAAQFTVTNALAFQDIAALRDKLALEKVYLENEHRSRYDFEEIVGSSVPLRRVLSLVTKVAGTDSTVLITGETGTGKELIARAIHKRSRRASRPFVSVNCGAIPPSLITSELFGYEKGAFTGAVQRHVGRFELADHGTIFLDEAGELPAEAQVALLRVLQERTFDRVGGTRPVSIDVRVIAATNRDLAREMAEGSFREDLYYRLSVFPIHVPPLRERAGDIPVLVEYLTHRYAANVGRKIRKVSERTMDLLTHYKWPGNVRELENTLTRAVVLAKGDVLDETALPIGAPSAQPTDADAEGDLPTLREIERRHIVRVLAHTEWNKRRACAILDISRPTLDRKIEEYGLKKDGEP